MCKPLSNAYVPTTTPEGEVFGRTLRRLRQERGLTQERFAASAGLTTGFVNGLELGYKTPGLLTILKISHALEVKPSELLTDFTPAAVRRMVG